MSQSIKLDNDMYWDASSIHSAILTAAWTATSQTVALTIVTENLLLTKGVWLILARTPSTQSKANMSYTFRSSSGTTDLNSQNYFVVPVNDGFGAILITVASETATIRLQTGASGSCTWAYTERAGLQAIKLSG